jgi:hypothetical protein
MVTAAPAVRVAKLWKIAVPVLTIEAQLLDSGLVGWLK